MEKKKGFHETLREKADQYAFLVYNVTKNFPKEEIYGLTSQLRRSALSVVLNYIEGYARHGDKTHKNFIQIAYGSLKESKYLLFFAEREGYLGKKDYDDLNKLGEELGAMLWGTIEGLKNK